MSAEGGSSGGREWAMVKLGPGDWLCWSNDRTTVWRFHQHVDGSVHGLVDCPYRERTFWRAIWMGAEQFRDDPESAIDADLWGPTWTTDSDYLPTRQAAIDAMLRERKIASR